MNTVQSYIDRYTELGKNLGLTGESVNALSQMLGYASYISEVEHASYMAEASLEKASLMNSKIQHCVDNMYSVFRGSCPRVIMKIKPTKYLSLNPYDSIIESQNFRVYYLGYLKVTDANGNIVRGGGITSWDETVEESSTTTTDGEEKETRVINLVSASRIADISEVEENSEESSEIEEDTTKTSVHYHYSAEEAKHATIDELLMDDRYTGSWEYSAATFYPVLDEDLEETEEDDTVAGIQVILGFIAPKRIGDNLTISETISTSNTYYVDCIADNLSDDMYVMVGGIDENGNQTGDMAVQPTTRIFAEHLLDHKIFDLTLPSFGSRLYLANFYKDVIGRDSQEVEGITPNAEIFAQYYGYSELDDYNVSELKKIQLKGTELLEFGDVYDDEGNSYTNPFLTQFNVVQFDGDAAGLCYIDAVPRDDLNTIHYKANRDRYVNSILRSNSDIGTVLEESYPEVVKSGGTSYVFNANTSSARYSTINLYYIPKQENVFLTAEQIEKFRNEKRAYYVITSTINVEAGHKFIATFNISLDLFKSSSEDWEQVIGKNILVSEYEKKFNVVFDKNTLKNIEATISKISNVKRVSDLNVTYTDAGKEVTEDYITSKYGNNSYFEIKYSITTSVSVQS